MDSTVVIIICILALLAVIAVRGLASRNGSKRPSTKSKAGTSRPAIARRPAPKRAADSSAASYQALSVVGNCTAARAIGGKRFLVREAPELPLPGCDAATCQCKFAHHDDRRREDYDRRQKQNQLRSELYVSDGHRERRVSRGRRATDFGLDPVSLSMGQRPA